MGRLTHDQFRKLNNYAKAGQTHRIAEIIRNTERCTECLVPLVVSEIGDVGNESRTARELRLAAGSIVGDEGMERWLECRVCGP